jgi:hypothetical protein
MAEQHSRTDRTAGSGEYQGEYKATRGLTIVGAALLLPGVLPVAQAENAPERGEISFKYLYYKDWEPSTDRIKVNAPSIGFLIPVAGQWSIEGSAVNDVLSGPTPRAYSISTLGQSSKMSDNRLQGDLKVTRYFPRAAVGVGLAYSNEHDYTSRTVSSDVRWSTENNNTTFNAGVGYSDDKINDNNGKITKFVGTQSKRTLELGFGVTQVLTPDDIGQINLTYSRGRGYFTDPYKNYDNRPDYRNQGAILFRWNHYVSQFDASLRLSYRYYRDNFIGIAHTFGAEWVQPFAGRYTVTPGIRFHTQNAANFYVDPVPSAASPTGYTVNPALVNGSLQYYSADQRLSAFGAWTVSLKLEAQIDKDWKADFKVENYEQRSNWRLGGSGSPGIAPFYARFYQLGATKQF